MGATQQQLEVRRGDIIWLKTDIAYNEFGGSVQSVNRPYIVISNNINNEKCSTVNIASLSKAVTKEFYPMHVYLDKKKYRLSYNSIVLAEQVKTIPRHYIKRKVSSLDTEDLKKLNRAIFVQMIDENLDMDAV